MNGFVAKSFAGGGAEVRIAELQADRIASEQDGAVGEDEPDTDAAGIIGLAVPVRCPRIGRL